MSLLALVPLLAVPAEGQGLLLAHCPKYSASEQGCAPLDELLALMSFH